MRKCLEECTKEVTPCQNRECRLWIDHEDDLNCTLYSIEERGKHTLEQVSERLGTSVVNIFQIEKRALRKLKKKKDLKMFLDSDTN